MKTNKFFELTVLTLNGKTVKRYYKSASVEASRHLAYNRTDCDRVLDIKQVSETVYMNNSGKNKSIYDRRNS